MALFQYQTLFNCYIVRGSTSNIGVFAVEDVPYPNDDTYLDRIQKEVVYPIVFTAALEFMPKSHGGIQKKIF